MSTPNVRLAFQGGGAKLVAMLPVADAFSAAEAAGEIELTSASGTSAGAICAALIASKADFAAVRGHIVGNGPAHLAKLIPDRVSKLVAQAQAEKIGFVSLVRNWKMLRDIAVAGVPVLNSSELSCFVRDLLRASTSKEIRNIEDCPIRLFVTTSDIVNSKGVTHTEGDLTNAVVDSCSLPILLRSFDCLSESHFVDGGLCENLPVDCLLGIHQETIFAVFPREQARRLRIKNILSYISSLLSASINHSVHRSISLVSKPFQFAVDTDLDLLDFGAAIKRLADDNWYRVERDRAARRITDFSRSYGFVLSPKQARVVDVVDVSQYQKALSNLATPNQHELHCTSVKFIVRVNCDQTFRSEAEAVQRQADTLTRVTKFNVVGSVPRYYRSHVNVNDDSVVPAIWSAKNLSKSQEIPIRALPLEKEMVSGMPARQCLIEFMEAEKYIDVNDQIELQCVYHSTFGRDMSPLNLGSSDAIMFNNGRDQEIPVAQIILIYPRRLGNITLMFNEQKSINIGSKPTVIEFEDDDRAFAGFLNDLVGLTLSGFKAGAKIVATVVLTRR